jgi:uncharacterized membrane protein YeaQ/YmgE (transglycosylase-associated protein family)
MVFLTIVEWLAVGLVVGFVAGKLVNLHGDDPRLGAVAATGGAVVAAAIYTFFSGAGMAGWQPWGLTCAAGGAVAGAVAWHAVRSRYVSRDAYTTRRSY